MNGAYTNQRVAHIHKGQLIPNQFSSIANDDTEQAYADLTYCEHKLWHYLAKNNNNYDWNVSSSYLYDHYGLDRKSYWRAYKGLINKGYIVEISSVEFNFYAHPSQNPNYNPSPPPPEEIIEDNSDDNIDEYEI